MAKGLSDDEIMKFIKSKDVSSKDYKAPKTKITRVDLSRIKTDNVKNTKTDNSVKNKVLRRTLVNTKPDNSNKKVNQTIYNKNAVRTSQRPEPKSIGSIDIVRNQSELRKTQNELQRQREKKLNPEGKNAAVETVKQAKQAMRAVENVGEKEAKNLIDFSTNAYKYAKAIKNRDDKQEAEAVSNMANAFDRSLVGRGVKTAGNFATRTGYGALKGADWMLDWGIDKMTSKPLQYAEFAEKLFNPNKKEEINKKYDTIQNYIDDYTKLNLAENIYEDLGWDEDAYRTWEKGSLVNRNNIGGQVAETMGEQFLPLLLGSEISSGLVGNEIGNKFAGTKLSKATAGLTGANKYLTGIKTVGENAAKYFIKNAPSMMPFWTTSYGGALEEALNEGATREEARRYATLNAAVETGTEMMFDGIPAIKGSSSTADAIANGLIDKATGKITNKFAKQVVSYLARMGYVGAGEGAEEMVSEILNPLLKNYTYSNGEKIDWKQVLQSGMMGFISGEVMGAQNTFEESRNAVNNQINRETFQNSIQNTVNNAAQTTFQEITSQLDQLAQQRVQQIDQAVRQGQMTAQEGTKEIEDIQRYVDAQKNTLQQEQQPQQNQNNQLAQQAVQQINQQVQNGQISPQDGIQQIEDIQNYLRAQEAQTQQNDNLVQDYMNSNYESLVGDYIDQNYGQQQESNLVEDYINEQDDNLVNDYMNNYEDGNMVENYMNAQNNQTQTQQENASNQNNIENAQEKEYNKTIKEEGAENEFRRLQEESRNISNEEQQSYRRGSKEIDEDLRRRLSRALGQRVESSRSSNSNNARVLKDNKSGNTFEIYDNVDGQTFRDVFEIARTYTKNGELVDLHPVETNEDATGYNDTKNFVTKDGLSGYAITKDGDLISVFNANNKRGWLRAIEPDIRKNAKTLDCYMSENQPLHEMYEKIFGFKTASVMDYNMEYDHDDIAKNHNMPQVAFMVKTDQDIETKHFNKDQYNEALEYRNSLVDNQGTSDSSFSNETNTAKETQNVAKQITDTINNEIKKNEIISNIEKQEGRPVRQGVKTITTATGTTNLISEMDGKIITYDHLSNDKLMNEVRGENAGKGLPTLYQECIDFIQSDKRIHAKDIAKIELTLTELQKNFNDKANIDMFTDLVQQAATLGTTDAQALQFMGVIKKLNPMSQLTALQKAVEISIKKGDKAFEGVQIKQELVDKVLQTQQDGKIDQQAFDEAMNALMDDISSQMKASFADKVNTWRYLSMLCNFKTHLRNVTGNMTMFGLQSYKDLYAAIGESTYDAIQKARGKEGLQERTATLKRATKEIKEFSKRKAEEIVKGQKNKYYENSKGIVGELKSRKKIWSDNNILGKGLNKLNKGNSFLLDWEDKFFSRGMVQKRLANYLAANMIRNQADMDAHPEVVARAIDYATFKGKEVTYHQDSTTADAIKKFRDDLYRGSGFSKAGGLSVDATLAFIKTPANIAKTALEYTPGIGLLNLKQQIKNAPKELKANVVIDSISKQFTGMTLVAAGMFLAGKGILRGIGDDDKEDEIRENLGEKNYSIKIGNQYFDLSFLAPSTIPLFEGVELYNSLKNKKGFDLNSSVDVMFGALNPATEMSVLQSVFSLMKSLGYGKNAVQQATGQTFSSYLMQFFPTFFSQAAQAIDPYQRKTNTGETVIDKTFDQIKNKIPGLRQTLPKKMNVWGKEQKNAENPFIRGLEAFLSPSNRSENKVDDTTKELFELAKKYDNKNKQILPTIQDKNLTINSVDYKTYGKDFENLQRTYGKTAKENLDKLLKSDSYKNASMDDKAYMIGQLYDYAEHKSKEEYAKNNNIEYGNKNTNRYSLVDAFGIDYEKYVEQRLSKIKSDKNEDGSSKKNATSKYLKALNELGLDELQKQAVMNFENKSYYIDEKAVENKINSSNLPDNQKKMLIEKIKKNVSKTEKERYKRAENIGVSYDLYSNFRQYATSVKADKTKNGGYVRGSKQQKIINWIESQNISASQKQKLYNDYKNNQGITTYYK